MPAGLLVNARLLSTAPKSSSPNALVVTPIINADPSIGWFDGQPRPVFPVEQATNDTAIILSDPLPEGTIVLLPLGQWTGPGTPYLLAVNTWYEGRIRTVSGDDVMSVRLTVAGVPRYYSDYDAEAVLDEDVIAISMPCHHITGVHTERILVADAKGITLNKQAVVGLPPMVAGQDKDVPARLVDKVALSKASFAGLRRIYLEQTGSLGDTYIFYQCAITDGKLNDNSGVKYVGFTLSWDDSERPFYFLSAEGISEQCKEELTVSDVTSKVIGAIAVDTVTDQIVHYN